MRQGSLCNIPDCPGTHSKNQASLELRDMTAFVSQVLGLMGSTHTTWLKWKSLSTHVVTDLCSQTWSLQHLLFLMCSIFSSTPLRVGVYLLTPPTLCTQELFPRIEGDISDCQHGSCPSLALASSFYILEYHAWGNSPWNSALRM